MVQAPGFIRGINPFSKIKNPQAPAFIRGVNLKSKIKNQKSIDWAHADSLPKRERAVMDGSNGSSLL
jgi:hypothetical protein